MATIISKNLLLFKFSDFNSSSKIKDFVNYDYKKYRKKRVNLFLTFYCK